MRFFEHNYKKIYGTFIALATIALWQNNANADSCTSGTNISIHQLTGTCANCVIQTHTCNGTTYNVQNCTSCVNSNATLTPTTATVGTCTITYNTCKTSSTPGSGTIGTMCEDTDCPLSKPTSGWQPTSPIIAGASYAYEYAANYICTGTKETSCKWTASGNTYRCAAGYYGKASCTSTSNCTGCTACIMQDGSRGTTTPTTNATDETSCYKNSTIKSTNASGTYNFVSKCNYSN